MKLEKRSVVVSMLVGIAVALSLVAGEEIGLQLIGPALMGVIYGVVIGFCSYLFMMCVAMLLCLVVSKSTGNGLTRVCLTLAPILAGFVVYATGVRLL
jgi:hypothetical protein